MARKNLIRSVITLIGLAALAVLVLISDGLLVVHAQTNQDATGLPRVLAAAQGAGILFADTEPIDDANGLPISGSTFVTFNWSYQWIRVDGNSETNVGADSATYQPVQADVGKLIKVQVSFMDGDNFSETVTSLPFGPIVEPASTLSPSKLVSNTGQSSTTANITQQYAMGFRLGAHGQGYEISSVSIDLAARPSSLTVSLWSGGVEGAFQPNNATKLFDFADPSYFRVGLNKFTAPAGAFAYQNVNYFVVLSGFGSTLSIKETTSNNEDAGGETGAVIYDKAAVRGLTATGRWEISDDRANVLRLAVGGSKRVRGILASSYAQNPIDDKGTEDTSDDTGPSQEVISVGDNIGFGIELGAADRYLIRGVSLNSDDSKPSGGGFTNPFDLRSGTRTGAKQFTLVNSRNAPGLTVWTAPRGATVAGAAGGQEYVFDQPVGQDSGDEKTRRRDGILFRVAGAAAKGVDDPAAAGVSFTGAKGDVALDHPYMALHGEPLDAMVQNLGRTNNSYVSVDSTTNVVSQGFTTGSDGFGYRLQGIGVNIEGSGSNFPDGPTSVSVAVYSADANGRPDAKLFDLVSPDEFGAGHSFFEAPPGTDLARSTSYVMVWRYVSGTTHRLQRTNIYSEDSGAATGSSIADAYYRGAGLGFLSKDSGGNSVEIAVYTETNLPPFEPGLTGGGPGHFGGDAILRCFVLPPDTCPTYDDVEVDSQEIWSAALTAGEDLTGTFVNDVGYEQADSFGNLDDNDFDLAGTSYTITDLKIQLPELTGAFSNILVLTFDTDPGTLTDDLFLRVGSRTFALADAVPDTGTGYSFFWKNHGMSWSDNDERSVSLHYGNPIGTPNAYGYRTIWTALMTAGTATNIAGYSEGLRGAITNDLIVTGRDETVTIGTPDQPRYPWTGYRINSLQELTNLSSGRL